MVGSRHLGSVAFLGFTLALPAVVRAEGGVGSAEGVASETRADLGAGESGDTLEPGATASEAGEVEPKEAALSSACVGDEPHRLCRNLEKVHAKIERLCSKKDLSAKREERCSDLRESFDDVLEEIQDDVDERRDWLKKWDQKRSDLAEACEAEELERTCRKLEKVQAQLEDECSRAWRRGWKKNPRCEELEDEYDEWVDELEEEEVAAGFVRDENGEILREPIVALLLPGAAAFLLSYGAPLAIFGSDGFREGTWVYAIPVVGPMSYVGKASDRWDKSGGTVPIAGGIFPLLGTVGVGALQGASAAAVVVGLVGRKRKRRGYKPVLSPLVLPGFQGGMISGVF